MTRLLVDATLLVAVLNGVRVTLGIPPISYWFRSRSCPTCNGVGHVKKVKAIKGVQVTRDGQTTEIEV